AGDRNTGEVDDASLDRSAAYPELEPDLGAFAALAAEEASARRRVARCARADHALQRRRAHEESTIASADRDGFDFALVRVARFPVSGTPVVSTTMPTRSRPSSSVNSLSVRAPARTSKRSPKERQKRSLFTR